jgi:hypothetical protein
LKGNELRAAGGQIGYFVSLSLRAKRLRGLYVKTKNEQELFLMKIY